MQKVNMKVKAMVKKILKIMLALNLLEVPLIIRVSGLERLLIIGTKQQLA